MPSVTTVGIRTAPESLLATASRYSPVLKSPSVFFAVMSGRLKGYKTGCCAGRFLAVTGFDTVAPIFNGVEWKLRKVLTHLFKLQGRKSSGTKL